VKLASTVVAAMAPMNETDLPRTSQARGAIGTEGARGSPSTPTPARSPVPPEEASVKVVFVTTGPERLRAAWQLFTALETENWELSEDIRDEYPTLDLLHGMGVVAAYLRGQLRHHAKHLGCDCGSAEWLTEVAMSHLATLEEDDDD
jgi:hypothetical protein